MRWSVRCMIKERIYLLSWEEFEKVLEKVLVLDAGPVEVLDFVRDLP